METARDNNGPVTDTTALGKTFSWKKVGHMVAVAGALAVGAFYFGFPGITLGILWGLPLGLFNYFLGCKAVSYVGAKRGTFIFAILIICRWVLAFTAVYVAMRAGLWFVLGVAMGVEIQMLSFLVDSLAVFLGLRW